MTLAKSGCSDAAQSDQRHRRHQPPKVATTAHRSVSLDTQVFQHIMAMNALVQPDRAVRPVGTQVTYNMTKNFVKQEIRTRSNVWQSCQSVQSNSDSGAAPADGVVEFAVMECLVPKYTQKSGESLAMLFVTTNTKVSEADVLHVKTRMLSRRQIFSEITKLAISRFRLPTHKVPNFQSSIAISRFLAKSRKKVG
ncbi:hypothetical protein C8F04DRAFT_1181904 [Mycena alexandri]|uniref:Uncharacterized protein n=1 Tax=Mycena alexandri TaxID=1745969 RepID=A0AAD6X411_9AGAR|nr:hypothetical protein C8F04DRAFT_1181904 [Mycena alexandri]